VEIRPFELFFDLVYALAVTQLTEYLLHHLTLRGAAEACLLLLAIWWAWIDTAWFTNWFDPDHRAIRVELIVLMLISLIMSAVLPDAFGNRGLTFAAMFALMELGRTGFAAIAFGSETRLRRNFERILVWRAMSSCFWLGGGFAGGWWRDGLWLTAALIDLAAPVAGFRIPVLGRSTTADWALAGGHLAERCSLFLLLALGESILVTGSNFGRLPSDAKTPAVFVVAFLGSLALWDLRTERVRLRAVGGEAPASRSVTGISL
jgi:low temperature requirement protein LtrA